MLIGLAADKKLPEVLLPFIQEKIFENPDATIRMQASNYFKRSGTDKTYFSIITFLIAFIVFTVWRAACVHASCP
jgi:hypothetical protein